MCFGHCAITSQPDYHQYPRRSAFCARLLLCPTCFSFARLCSDFANRLSPLLLCACFSLLLSTMSTFRPTASAGPASSGSASSPVAFTVGGAARQCTASESSQPSLLMQSARMLTLLSPLCVCSAFPGKAYSPPLFGSFGKKAKGQQQRTTAARSGSNGHMEPNHSRHLQQLTPFIVDSVCGIPIRSVQEEI